MALGVSLQKEMVTAIARDVLAEKGTIFSVETGEGEKYLRDVVVQLELLILGFNVISKTSLLRLTRKTEALVQGNTLHARLQNLPLDGLWSSNDYGVCIGSSEVQYARHDQLQDIEGSFSFIQVEQSQHLSDFDINRIKLLARASGATVVFFGQSTGANSSFGQLIQRNKRAQFEMRGKEHFMLFETAIEDPQEKETYLRAS
jgi:hypothetical protein